MTLTAPTGPGTHIEMEFFDKSPQSPQSAGWGQAGSLLKSKASMNAWVPALGILMDWALHESYIYRLIAM